MSMAEVAVDAPLVNLSEIAEIELFILKRMKEFTLGDHASLFKGSGFNFVGLRDWQPGDRVSSVDWAQSSLNNFSPLVTREFEQDSNATIVAVADASMSTRCGVNGVPIAAAIARSVAAVGLSAVFFQDQFGLITFDDRFRQMAAARPRMADRIEEWQTHVSDLARDNDLDLVRVGLDRWEMETTLIEFARERRLRKFQ